MKSKSKSKKVDGPQPTETSMRGDSRAAGPLPGAHHTNSAYFAFPGLNGKCDELTHKSKVVVQEV